MLYVLLAVVAIAAVGYFIYKKVHAASAIFAVGVLLLMIAAATGRVTLSTQDIESSGNAFYDELLIIESLFKSRFSGTGMAIMVLFGFVGYMRHIGADAKTVVALSQPLRRFEGSYWLVPVGFAVGTLLSLVVPSASALSLLLVATLMPALIAAGLTPLTVGAIVVTSSTIAPSPLEAGLIQGADLVGMTVTEFTFGNVAYATVPALIVVAFTHMWWQRRCDLRDVAKVTAATTAGEVEEAKESESDRRIQEAVERAEGLPGFYALLPLLPLLLIVISAILNRMGVVGFEADILPVTVVSLMVTMIIEAIRLRNVTEAVDALQDFFKGLGEGAAGVVSLIVAAAILVEGITQMGVIDALTSLAQASSGAAALMVIVFVLATGLMAVLTGSGVAPYFAFSEMVPGLAAESAVHAPQMLASIWSASNLMRQASPVNAAVLIVSGALKINPVELVRRTFVPMLVGTISAVIFAFLLIG
ncbi:Putative cryptic C4-dicarboxylate transporter DcuD [Corynebacterium glaucum]|uniref:Putative cryptic C4-dicarboxylate transporter DcuD n=1 Tax=Corynebacterium glaucum TaxID=187491 RepID=A0A1Q2HZR2_9CORY|nr:C4-dicarboxylate transporter DcuC [Corynebacterium glaucum]AQQ16337.1 Putative cryptic C4-dicarboxylate transporter DcuD [Corynebacterium glaucum]